MISQVHATPAMSQLRFWQRNYLLDISILGFQFLILLFLAFPSGYNTHITFYGPDMTSEASFGIFCSATEIAKSLGYNDPANYIIGAQKFLSGWLSGSDSWFLACWPPGFFLVESFFMKILGINCPIIFCLLLLIVIVWTLTLWIVYLTLTQWQSRSVAAMLSTSLCFTQLFRYFFLNSGIILSESLSTALLIIGLSLCAQNLQDNKFKRCLLAGLCLGIAAYMRAQFEIFSLCLLAFLGILVCLHFIFSAKYRQIIKSCSLTTFLTIPMHRLLMAALCAQIIMLPYRGYNYAQYGTLSWVRLDYYWKSMWQDPAITLKNHGLFALLGGVNVAAQTNPDLAKEMKNSVAKFGPNYYSDSAYKQAAIVTFIHNPVKWLNLKAAYIPWAWFDSLYISRERVCQIENWFYVVLFYLVFSLAVIRTVFLNHNFYQDNTIDYFFLSIVFSQLICSIFAHLEPRYFYLLKIGSIITGLFYLAIYFKLKRTPKANSSTNLS